MKRDNSLDSMPYGGEMILEARQDGNHLRIRIFDADWGIAQEDLESVCDPFFTSKTRGAGLGLTTVHQIVANHDGEIKIQSHKGKGATVTTHLPVKT